VGEIETDALAGTIETVALSDAVVSAALCAVTVTELDGSDLGAVYMPEEVTVPTVEFPPSAPFTIQFTAVLLVPETAALNCWEFPTCRLALVGETETETSPERAAVTETAALAEALDCATLRAVTVMVPDGATGGALYKPDEEIIPVVELPPIFSLTSHLTALSPVPDTEALNCSDCPTPRVEELGEIETLTDPFVRGRIPLLPSPAAPPHAQKVRQIKRGNRTRSRGFLIGRFWPTHPEKNKVTKGHMRGTSQKYIFFPLR
jgi:hypothetical protein